MVNVHLYMYKLIYVQFVINIHLLIALWCIRYRVRTHHTVLQRCRMSSGYSGSLSPAALGHDYRKLFNKHLQHF